MREFVFVTNNPHKLLEISDLAGGAIYLNSLSEIGYLEDIQETATTIKGNASIKSQTIFSFCGRDCFADDTGLEVDVLGGAPGVHSARYAGEGKFFNDNIDKLLRELNGKENRKARFLTVISLILGGKEFFFEGIVDGIIINEKRGNGGFGYDSIFVPEGFDKTFAEMDAEEKNAISHRGKAFAKMMMFLGASGCLK